MNAFGKVLPATARANDAGRLEIGGCDAVELARDHGTPLFVLDAAHLRDRLRRYADAFGADRVHYASKAFLVSSLVPFLTDAGVGIDCASGGELHVALHGGMPPERVVLHGNNKTPDELVHAVEAGVGTIVLDSPVERERLDAICAERGVRASVLVRITPGIEAHTHEYLKTGIEDTKFGHPIGDVALEAVRAAAASDHLELRGIHCHIGSQILDLEPFEETARVMVRFLARCREATGLELPVLDLGGGLGIAYTPDEDPPEIEALAKVVDEAVTDEAERAGTAVPSVHVEPGRSLVGPAVVTLHTVGTVKDVPGVRRYVSVDGGMSDNIRPMLYGARYTFVSAERPQAPHEHEVAVSGSLCETGDVLRTDASLPDVQAGEILAVAATGAYGYVMASNYNKQPRPAVLAVSDGQVSVLARRETLDDLVRLDER